MTPFPMVFKCSGLLIATIHRYTKFELPGFTHSRDTRCCKNCKQDHQTSATLTSGLIFDQNWYGVVEFNVPLDTVQFIPETGPPGGSSAVMCISHSAMESQLHNNPLKPALLLFTTAQKLAPNPRYSGGS